MRVLGVDPSSTIIGYGLATNGSLKKTSIWDGRKFKGSEPDKLMAASDACEAITKLWKPDIAVVELCAVSRNLNVVRVLSKFEATQIMALKRLGVTVIQGRVTSARKIVLGNGGLSKDDAWKLVTTKTLPNHKWRKKNQGGEDEMDAAVLALAGPGVVEGA